MESLAADPMDDDRSFSEKLEMQTSYPPAGKARGERNAERVLYDGRGRFPVGLVVLDLFVSLLLPFVGLPLLVVHVLRYYTQRLTITSRRVTWERGLVSRRIDVLDLFRVRDVVYEATLGFGRIVVDSSDRSTPRLKLPLPRARELFEPLRNAVAEARRASNVVVNEVM